MTQSVGKAVDTEGSRGVFFCVSDRTVSPHPSNCLLSHGGGGRAACALTGHFSPSLTLDCVVFFP